MKKFLDNIDRNTMLESFLNTFLCFIRREITITSDAPERKWFDFEHRTHVKDVSEYFGLGLHLILTPLRRAEK
jgi:hypothetical protein